ncbi:MAG: PQQ-binding-like beta-propeller repeat protein, partial [Planctomycetaceae bacterium]|nr:PQQ-binding-like beta-propeller repeat protein [Planctomycetaceae bacterium]
MFAAIFCRRVLRVLAVCFSISAVASLAAAQEAEDKAGWWRFRGPNGSGVSSSTRLPVKWTVEEADWRVQLPGVGHCSPVIRGNHVFVTCGEEDSGHRQLLCLTADSGQVVWKHTIGEAKHRKHSLNSFASSTPALDAERVYVSWVDAENQLQVKA